MTKKLDVLFCDENGHLWLVFNEAVICHILHNNETYIFTEYDGFQVNSFFRLMPNSIVWMAIFILVVMMACFR